MAPENKISGIAANSCSASKMSSDSPEIEKASLSFGSETLFLYKDKRKYLLHQTKKIMENKLNLARKCDTMKRDGHF